MNQSRAVRVALIWAVERSLNPIVIEAVSEAVGGETSGVVGETVIDELSQQLEEVP